MMTKNKNCKLKNDVEKEQMSQTKNVLKNITSSSNSLQPIVEATQNAIEASSNKKLIYIYIYNTLGNDNNIQDIKIIVRDNGDGFDLKCKNGNKFGRFGDWYNNDKSPTNQGCGRAQFLHFFNQIYIYSKNKDTNEKFTWSFDIKNDLQDITNTHTNKRHKTHIEFSTCNKNKIKELYKKVNINNIKQLKQGLMYSCLLNLLNFDDNDKICIFIKENQQIKREKITKCDVDELTKDKRNDNISIFYKKPNKQLNSKNEIIWEQSTEHILTIKEYKLFNKNIKNQFYLCANNQIIKEIGGNIIDKNFNIIKNNEENESNKFHLLYLISGEILDERCNSERDDFDFDNIEEVEKDIKEFIKKETFGTMFTEQEYLFEEEICKSVKENVKKQYPSIQEQIEKEQNDIKEICNYLGVQEDEMKNVLDKKKESAIKYISDKIGYRNTKTQLEIIDKYKQLLTNDKQRGGDEKEVKTIESKDSNKNKDRFELAKELNSLVKQANKDELTNYVVRRQIACEMLKHYNSQISNKDEMYNEDYFHNLIIPMGTTEKDNVENNLWMLNEDYSHYTHYSSNVNLKDVQYNGEKIFTEDIDEEFLKLCNETINTNKQQENIKINKPDVLIFNDLRHFIIIDFKRPDVNCSFYVDKITEYAELMANKIKNRKNNDLKFYCFLIGANIGKGTGLQSIDNGILPSENEEEKISGWYGMRDLKKYDSDPSQQIKIGTAEIEILKYSYIRKLADLRNRQFVDKLGLKDEINIIVSKILNNK